MSKQEIITRDEQAILPTAYLKEIGLDESQMDSIVTLANELDQVKPADLTVWGREAAEHTVAYADRMLDLVTTADLEKTGKQLRSIISHAKQINTSKLSFQRSRVPIIGKLVDRFRVRYSGIMTQFATAREAIDQTANEIAETQRNLEQRINDLEEGYAQVTEEYVLLGRYIAAGKLGLSRLEKRVEGLKERANEPLIAQEISDLQAIRNQLRKRVADLTVLQQNALNTQPAIRLVQANNSTLIDKYHTITSLTIPTWKRQILIGLTLEEQAEAVELAENVDTFTNEMLRQQADLLKKNTIATAKSNQRLVIDVETINYVQNSLLETVSGVIEINKKAETEQNEAIARIMDSRKTFQERLVSQDTASIVH